MKFIPGTVKIHASWRGGFTGVNLSSFDVLSFFCLSLWLYIFNIFITVYTITCIYTFWLLFEFDFYGGPPHHLDFNSSLSRWMSYQDVYAMVKKAPGYVTVAPTTVVVQAVFLTW